MDMYGVYVRCTWRTESKTPPVFGNKKKPTVWRNSPLCSEILDEVPRYRRKRKRVMGDWGVDEVHSLLCYVCSTRRLRSASLCVHVGGFPSRKYVVLRGARTSSSRPIATQLSRPKTPLMHRPIRIINPPPLTRMLMLLRCTCINKKVSQLSHQPLLPTPHLSHTSLLHLQPLNRLLNPPLRTPQIHLRNRILYTP